MTSTLTVIVPESIRIDDDTIKTVLAAHTDATITVHSMTVPDTDWAFDGACPHCGSADIRVVRGCEETYRGTDDDLVYDGHATDTVVLQTEELVAFCGSCDTTLYEHPAYTTLRTDTL